MNYPADYEEWFLIAPAGRQIQITFEAFELEQSQKCNNAFVEIREAYFDDGPYRDDIEAGYGTILAEHLCGNSLPQKIQSAGNMAWVKFKSDKNAATNFKGFKASFKAGMHQRYQTCHRGEGVLPYMGYKGTCRWIGYGFWPLCPEQGI